MIELLPDLPEGTLGFRLTGDVTRDDYERVLVPALHAVVDLGGRLRTIFLVEDLEEIEPGALWADARLGFDVGVRHHGAWERTAVVTDVEWIARAIRLFAWMIPGQVRAYALAERDAAEQWVAGTGD